VLGVGPDLIEIDAKFVQGNSGSPILNEAGEVLGLATFAVKHAEPENWLKEDSRFKEIRRYGVRIEGTTWVEMDMEGFQKRAALLADLNEMFTHIYHMKFTEVYDNAARTEVVYNASIEAGKFREYRWFARDLGTYAVQLNGAWEWVQSFRRGVNEHNRTRSQSQRRDAVRDIKMSQLMYQQRIVGFRRESDRLRAKVRRLLAHDHWGTDYFLEKAKVQYKMLNHILEVPE